MSIDDILWALTDCDTRSKEVRISYKTAEAIAACLRAGQAMRAPIILGTQSDKEVVIYDMDGWAFVKAVQDWDAAVKREDK